ncbi:hypothetical protein BDY19DRAFT_488840 [Irpex rosettiformis]|uniref:Uncharacterized protein n=1 Tax=Irpex rosettiformis TaxID=378272 RepID=A0ACB8UE53_9APHY|nr:hypothetical protein BDY19DRAFT_488840 [Irpex rosettiformis]
MDTVKQAINGNSEISQAQPAPVMAASMIKTESSSGSRAPSLGIATPEPAQGLPNSSQRLDPKVMTILDLNAELLKACMEFQTRGISMTDPRAQQFFGRLQNNLGWLAAAADSKPNHQVHPLPQMQPPPAVDFLSMDRIQALYTELPVIFAKDLRRRSMSAAVPGAMSASISNGILKRERHEDFVGDSVSANKRQHTGESRGPSLAPSTPQSASSPAQSISSSMMPPATPPGSMPPPSLPGPSVPSPSMLPPSMPISMHGNQTDPQLIARERARQAQARQLAMGGQTSIGGDGTRQMSPGSQQGMPNSAGPSSMGHNPQAQMAALNQMGPMGLQIMQALQNPSHQVTQYLHNSIPNFQALPPQQQMSQFMRVQQLMRRQQAVQAAQAGSHSMGGMQPGGGPQGMMGGNMVGGSMGLSNESPTRMSPTGHQFPTGSTGGGMSPSNPMSGLTAAQQNNLQSLTPVQKQQLMMLQQHQQMRSGNVNPNMLNQQALTMQQQHQQRIIQQMASSAHVGSPMLGGTADGGNFPPSLRSNPSVPGIARSTRTPSDHSQSPMTPQLSQLGGQRGMNQLPQAGMGGNMNQSWPQNSQMGQGQGYGMSPPNSAGGFGGMSGGASSPMSNQQWNQNSQMMFSGGMGNQQLGDIGGLPISRQTSATPVPQPQLAQNSPMGDGAGMNDFDIFNWTQ